MVKVQIERIVQRTKGPRVRAERRGEQGACPAGVVLRVPEGSQVRSTKVLAKGARRMKSRPTETRGE